MFIAGLNDRFKTVLKAKKLVVLRFPISTSMDAEHQDSEDELVRYIKT
jgi:hypothetical protein